MNQIREAFKSRPGPWLVLIIAVLVGHHGPTMHVHGFSHDTGHHGLDAVDQAPDYLRHQHKHQRFAHLSIDGSHAEHHQAVLSQSDARPDSVPAKILLKLVFIALLWLWLLPLLLHALPVSWRQTDIKPKPPRYLLFPLLRAPPHFS